MTRVHVLSLPHTHLTKAFDWCAYTAKVRRFPFMLEQAGYDVSVYGPDQYEPGPATQHPVVFDADRKAWFGSETWDHQKTFGHWDPNEDCWRIPNERAAAAIRENWQHGDMIGVIAGRCQELVVNLLADLKPQVVEWGIGYVGILDAAHHVYESHAWAHHLAGIRRNDEIAYFDTVIGNCYNTDEFTFKPTHDGYLLYVGRAMGRKGIPIIAEIAKHVDMPILRAGQPGDDFPGVEHVGVVTGQAKSDLFAGAAALLCPTTYLEPFGGVTVEAMMSGVPVITTDWGVFTETVTPGITGQRARTLRQFLSAVEEVQTYERSAIARHARARWSLEAGAKLYGEYLDTVRTLYGKGWYAL